MHVLYIEDNPNDANLVRRFTQSSGYELTVLNSLQNVEQVWRIPFDIVLIDVLLDQERAGYQIAQYFRTGGYRGAMVAVTALNSPQDMDDCEQAGFDAVLNKPYQIGELEHIFQSFLN